MLIATRFRITTASGATVIGSVLGIDGLALAGTAGRNFLRRPRAGLSIVRSEVGRGAVRGSHGWGNGGASKHMILCTGNTIVKPTTSKPLLPPVRDKILNVLSHHSGATVGLVLGYFDADRHWLVPTALADLQSEGAIRFDGTFYRIARALTVPQQKLIDKAKRRGGATFVYGATVRVARTLAREGYGTLRDDGLAELRDGERWVFELTGDAK